MGANITAIMNPDNGPGTDPIEDYVQATTAFKNVGGWLLGYVFSCFGGEACTDPGETRTADDVVNQALLYDNWYGPLRGVFIDQVSSNLNDFDFYQNIVQQIKNEKPDWIIVANPGVPVDQKFLDIFDIIVVADNNLTTPAPGVSWATSFSPYRQANFWSEVPLETMPAVVANARSQNVGYIYVTDGSSPDPFDTLSSYFAELLAQLV